MNKGDKVLIHDGSYAMVSDNDTQWVDISGNVLVAEGVFEVLEIGEYPEKTDNSTAKMFGVETETNNLLLRSVKNPDRKVCTQMRFCSSV